MTLLQGARSPEMTIQEDLLDKLRVVPLIIAILRAVLLEEWIPEVSRGTSFTVWFHSVIVLEM